MSWLRSVGLMAGALALAALLPACGGGEKKDTVRIAVCGPMTGSAAEFGDMIAKAAKLKETQVNAAGGVDVGGAGRMELEIVVFDDKGDPSEATNVARKVAADSSISAVIGHFNSSCSNAAKEGYGEGKIVALSPGSTNVSVCKGSPYMFRNLYQDDFQGQQIAVYVKEQLGLDKVALLYETDDYGSGLADSFRAKAGEIGLEVTNEGTFLRERTQDFKPLVQSAMQSGAQAMFVAGLYNEASLAAKAAKDDLNWDVTLIGGDGVMDEAYIANAGAAVEGALVTTPFLFNSGNDSGAATQFMADFRATYSEDPNTWGALTYDALGMMLEAIEAVGADREAIRGHLAGIRDEASGYHGVTGVTYFDEEGDCYSKPIYVAVVKDGVFVPAEAQLTD